MHHVASWWPHRHRADVLFVHYNDLQRDLAGEVRRLAAFVGVEVDAEDVAALVAGASIEAMRQDAIDAGDGLAMMFRDGARGFFNQGTNGRWEGLLDDEELALYARTRDAVLPQNCATWLEQGRPVRT